MCLKEISDHPDGSTSTFTIIIINSFLSCVLGSAELNFRTPLLFSPHKELGSVISYHPMQVCRRYISLFFSCRSLLVFSSTSCVFWWSTWLLTRGGWHTSGLTFFRWKWGLQWTTRWDSLQERATKVTSTALPAGYCSLEFEHEKKPFLPQLHNSTFILSRLTTPVERPTMPKSVDRSRAGSWVCSTLGARRVLYNHLPLPTSPKKLHTSYKTLNN